jgi:uncharacterized pyridoxamine 5'-phosphate oxidase family protein
MEIKGKLIYCTKHKLNYFVSVENNDFIKLVSSRKDVVFDQLQFSRPYFIDLVRNGKLIISR